MGLRVANIIEEGRLAGPQIRIAEVARHLLDWGIETTVVYPKLENERFKRKLGEYRIKNKELPLHRLTKDKKLFVKYSLFFFHELILLYRFLKKEQFDIVHCSGGSWQYKGVIAGKLAGSKTLWHLNDTSMPVFIRLLFKIIASIFTDGLIVSGKQVNEYYVENLGLQNIPIFEIQAPVDTDYFDPHKIKAGDSLFQNKGINIVTVGNVNPWKGFEYFIHMADMLNSSYKGLNFYIVGPQFNSQKTYSAYLQRLKDKLQLDNLHFMGYCSDIRDILLSADIFVCSSIKEASPMSVWEAMSMGKPIVSTDVGDVPFFLKDGLSGFIVPAKDAKSIADKVKILIANPKLRKAFGEKTRGIARDYLDVKVIVKNHIDAYQKIIGTNCG